MKRGLQKTTITIAPEDRHIDYIKWRPYLIDQKVVMYDEYLELKYSRNLMLLRHEGKSVRTLTGSEIKKTNPLEVIKEARSPRNDRLSLFLFDRNLKVPFISLVAKVSLATWRLSAMTESLLLLAK
ncbi:hypothetical protein BHM03_00050209 [Ensete ventricosum]|nr:hypothetical protein BHM03_00050209 [Ensete ventricosum]